MKQSLFSKEISPKCAYCAIGRLSVSDGEILCKKMGIMQPDSCCKSFRYDPLKRMPQTVKIASDFLPQDFEL